MFKDLKSGQFLPTHIKTVARTLIRSQRLKVMEEVCQMTKARSTPARADGAAPFPMLAELLRGWAG